MKTSRTHPRRLSSTPIKSIPRAARQRSNSVGSGGFTECKGSSVDTDAFMVREDVLKTKVSIEDAEEDNHTNSDVSSCGRSDFEVQEVDVNPPPSNTLCFREQSDHLYDKRSYQDEDSRRDSASEVTQDDDVESESVLSDADSTLSEDRHLDRVVFDDNDTWNDLEDTPVNSPSDSRGVSKATVNGISPQERTLLRKIAGSKAAELDKGKTISSANQEPNPPPASQLMTKLFPSLKPKAQNVPLPPPPPHPAVAPESKKLEVEPGETQTLSETSDSDFYLSTKQIVLIYCSSITCQHLFFFPLLPVSHCGQRLRESSTIFSAPLIQSTNTLCMNRC